MELDDGLREDVLNRLRRVEGQVRGLQNMVTQDVNCRKVASQVKAARTALDAVGKLILACYLAESLRSGPVAERDAISLIVKF